MPAEELPVPGMPKVESTEPGVQRWTFATTDPKVRRDEYRYWRGLFGLEEDDEPFEQNEQFWLVRGPTVAH